MGPVLSVSPDHWLPDAHRVISSNCNERPAQTDISLLVIHNISLPAGEFGGPYIEQLFTNCLDCSCHDSFTDLENLEVSSHLLIDRKGDITQFVPFNRRAWHAGQSSFKGEDNCNDFSIGIELEGTDELPYEAAQYDTLVRVCRQIMGFYPLITRDRIVGHCDIAPERKTDPGPAFDWGRLFNSLG